MCHYASDKSCGDFSLKMQLNEFGGWATPGPAGRGYSDPQISWLDLRGEGRDKGIEKDRRGGDSCGRGQKKERS